MFFPVKLREQIDQKFMLGGLKSSFAKNTGLKTYLVTPSSSSPSRVFRRRLRGGGPSREWLRRRRR